jgi:uncharacterized protein (UPF0248 family)
MNKPIYYWMSKLPTPPKENMEEYKIKIKDDYFIKEVNRITKEITVSKIKSVENFEKAVEYFEKDGCDAYSVAVVFADYQTEIEAFAKLLTIYKWKYETVWYDMWQEQEQNKDKKFYALTYDANNLTPKIVKLMNTRRTFEFPTREEGEKFLNENINYIERANFLI